MASVSLVPVAKKIPHLLEPHTYKMVNLTELITQPPRHIIKHTSLLSLRIDDFLSINRLVLLSSGVSG